MRDDTNILVIPTNRSLREELGYVTYRTALAQQLLSLFQQSLRTVDPHTEFHDFPGDRQQQTVSNCQHIGGRGAVWEAY